MKLYKSLSENLLKIKKTILGEDVLFFDFNLQKVTATAVYIDNLTDKEVLGKLAISPLSSFKGELESNEIIKKINLPEADIVKDFDIAVQKIISGDTVIFIDSVDFAISTACKKPAVRMVGEPPTSSVLKGPREGFVENIQINIKDIMKSL